MNRETLVYGSLGAGTQSSALLVLSALGLREVPRADVWFFADTGSEPQFVYDHLDLMTDWAARHDIKVIRCSRGNLGEDLLRKIGTEEGRFASVPFWTLGKDGRAAPTRRQCTRDYKIEVIERAVREYTGIKKHKHMRTQCTAIIGISWDERQRCKDSRTPWITNRYPLVESKISVDGCRDILRRNHLPIPGKSACVFCPYHSNAYWRWLREQHPDEWARAVIFDEAIRDQSSSGMENPTFVHRSLTPLHMVDLGEARDEKPIPQAGLFDGFREECDGMCGV